MKFFIKTYGCQMNDYDSAKLEALLAGKGHVRTCKAEEADVIIVNTCSVRQNAEDRAIAFLSSHQPLRKLGKKLCIAGCTANLHGEKLREKYGFIDFICGPNNYKDLPEMLEGTTVPCMTGDSVEPFIFDSVKPVNSISASIAITKGCENFCSYCVVPLARGKLVSKTPQAICGEIRELVSSGTKEILLLGQNVNEYGKDIRESFPALLQTVHEIDGVKRIGFTTSHPKDVPAQLIKLFAELPRLYKHLHIPLQSGSDRILKMMNRKYTFGQYSEIIKKARESFPGITITSDIIAGYPTETREDFLQTCDALEKIAFDDLYVFKYSPRPNTAASKIKDDVPESEKERRHRILLEIQDREAYSKNLAYEGRTLQVFTRNRSDKKAGLWIGRTDTNKPVFFLCPKDIEGEFKTVKIRKAFRRYLEGTICGEQEKGKE